MQYVALGLTVEKALQISGITKHQYYYKSDKKAKRGRKPSKHTLQILNGELIKCPNEQVTEQMKQIHKDPDLRYGYKKMTTQLKILGYEINHKKVYRLMNQANMLQLKPKRKIKKYATYRILMPNEPLEILEMDIKFVWIESQQRFAYILTILDVFTRMVLGWHVGMSINQHTVKEVFSSVVINHLQPNNMLSKGVHIEVRNDNDKRFSAKSVQQFFKDNYLNQVFTHPYTPQENGHIESFHSILGRSIDRFDFLYLNQLEQYLTVFYEKYNNTRLHGSIANLPPKIFWDNWNLGNINRIVLKNKKVKFKLNIPYNQISGYVNLREASCLNKNFLDGDFYLYNNNKVNDAITNNQLSVQRSPSVASC